MGGAYASVAETVGLKPKDVKGAVEEAGIIQDRRCVEFKVEVEARDPRSKGCEPFHEGAMCVQGQACQQDCQGFADEEVQGDGELSSSFKAQTACTSHDRPWWADPPGRAGPCILFRSADDMQ